MKLSKIKFPKFNITKEHTNSLLRGFGISIAGSALAFIASSVIPDLQASATNLAAIVLVSLCSNLVNALRIAVKSME